jgi:hypothetical protein
MSCSGFHRSSSRLATANTAQSHGVGLQLGCISPTESAHPQAARVRAPISAIFPSTGALRMKLVVPQTRKQARIHSVPALDLVYQRLSTERPRPPQRSRFSAHL